MSKTFCEHFVEKLYPTGCHANLIIASSIFDCELFIFFYFYMHVFTCCGLYFEFVLLCFFFVCFFLSSFFFLLLFLCCVVLFCFMFLFCPSHSTCIFYLSCSSAFISLCVSVFVLNLNYVSPFITLYLQLSAYLQQYFDA